ncbi:glycosyltransferase [Microvirga lotononidis]|uniref:Glycosyl transferase, UDP-glucuronosyltransferase n=1 Tax=Microvirga lotononidis TaxID=864069 RepID=I4YU87_9HYPH|nr:glycosyltransferase [Microvirga lotononidis]EIM27529.1 glycosyl transferase, UDP-glucuronosyltransferase [Microvirga lotononidis]WQO28321.1 glycosyltransferase [Microvirga lotononidis]
MRVLLSTYGSRGDVQPMAGLGLALQKLGAEALISAPSDAEFVALLDRAGLPLAPAFMPVRQWIATARQLGLSLPQLAARMVPAQFDAIAAAAEGCDAIVATGLFPSVAAAQAVAEKLGIDFICAVFYPIALPSPHHPPMEYPGWPHPPEMTDNRALWAFNAQAKDALFGAAVNTHRASVGLPTHANIRDHVFTLRPWLASDPVLSPWQPTEMTDAVQTGAWILPDARPLPADLETFLDAGAPPVYVGFGSMTMHASGDSARTAIEAVRAQGRRVIVAQGWANLMPIDDRNDCFAVGDVNQQALFTRVAAVVHHGGAGTTTAAACAGAPQVIVPQCADQPYWARRVTELGIGAAHDGPVPRAESLPIPLQIALVPGTRERAAAIAKTIRRDGAAVAAERLVAAIQGKASGVRRP